MYISPSTTVKVVAIHASILYEIFVADESGLLSLYDSQHRKCPFIVCPRNIQSDVLQCAARKHFTQLSANSSSRREVINNVTYVIALELCKIFHELDYIRVNKLCLDKCTGIERGQKAFLWIRW